MDNPENWLHWVHKTQDKDVFYVVFCFVCLCPVSCVPNVASSLDCPFLIALSGQTKQQTQHRKLKGQSRMEYQEKLAR
jgi:hypothetical protein